MCAAPGATLRQNEWGSGGWSRRESSAREETGSGAAQGTVEHRVHRRDEACVPLGQVLVESPQVIEQVAEVPHSRYVPRGDRAVNAHRIRRRRIPFLQSSPELALTRRREDGRMPET